MANALQLRRGTTAQHSTFTGLAGEVTVDTDKETVVVHDGSTAGGFPLAKASDLSSYATSASLAAVATSGSYTDLTNTPTLPSDFVSAASGGTFSGDITVTGNITTTGYLAGPANFTIDPAAVGDNTGTVIIAGNLQVDGTTTTINSTTTTINDLNIVVASGAANAAAANGGGLTVDGASANLAYYSGPDAWSMNKDLLLGLTTDAGFASGDQRIIINGTANARFEFGINAAQLGGFYSDASQLVMYTSTSAKLSLQTNSTERASIDGNGKLSILGTTSLQEVIEKASIATSTTGTIDFNLLDQSVQYYTADQTANRTINFRGDASTTLDSTMAVGESMTLAVLMTQGSTAYYLNAYQIDGSAVTPKWQGGTAPTGGNASGVDVYTFSIIKTASATFTVLASQVQFA